MPKKRLKPLRLEETGDSAAYLDEWASKLAEALTPDQLILFARNYERQARDDAASAEDRKFARQRAKAIRKRAL
jgi:hypothetical protein